MRQDVWGKPTARGGKNYPFAGQKCLPQRGGEAFSLNYWHASCSPLPVRSSACQPMKRTSLTTLLCSAALFAASPAHAAIDLLLNGGFENGTSTFATGNNIGVTVPAWTLVSGNTNVQQGPATGTGFSTPNLPVYNGAFSGGVTTGTTASSNQTTDTGGNHFFDGTNDSNGFTTITQTFTLSTGTNLSGSYALGVRDTGGNVAGTATNFNNGTTSRIDILNSSNVAVYTSYGDLLTPGATGSANPGWEVNNMAIGVLPAGTYTFRVTLAGAQNIDAINVVPEPSAWATLGLGLVGTAVVTLRRRRTL